MSFTELLQQATEMNQRNIATWQENGADKQKLIKVDTSAFNCAKLDGVHSFWCPERAMWLRFQDMIQLQNGWYTLKIAA